MKRGIEVFALVALAAASTVLSSQAQTAFGADGILNSNVLVADTAYGAPRAAESGLGNNGQQISAWSTVRTSSGVLGTDQCHSFPISRNKWLDLCADDDGCTVRVTSDATLLRASSGPHVLVTTADGTGWSVGKDSSTNTAGTNGDGTEKLMLGASSSSDLGGKWQCQLVDDAPTSTSVALELYVCHNDLPNQGSEMSCTVRFDD